MKIIPLLPSRGAGISPDLQWDGQAGDLVPAGLTAATNRGGYQSENPIQTAVVICLQTDIRVDETELNPGDENRGWPGDGFDLQGFETPLGSRLWLLRRRRLDEFETVQLAETYAEEALQTLIDQGVCVRAEVRAEAQPEYNRLNLEVSLFGKTQTKIYNDRFAVLWENFERVSGPLNP